MDPMLPLQTGNRGNFDLPHQIVFIRPAYLSLCKAIAQGIIDIYENPGPTEFPPIHSAAMLPGSWMSETDRRLYQVSEWETIFMHRFDFDYMMIYDKLCSMFVAMETLRHAEVYFEERMDESGPWVPVELRVSEGLREMVLEQIRDGRDRIMIVAEEIKGVLENAPADTWDKENTAPPELEMG